MTAFTRSQLAIAVSIALPLAALAGPTKTHPVAAAAASVQSDQTIADTVASALASNTKLAGFQVDVLCEAGVVELSGTVRSDEQKAEMIRQVRHLASVKAVKDSIGIRDASEPVTQTQATASPPLAMNGPGVLPMPLPQAAGMIQGGMPIGPGGFEGGYPGAGAAFGPGGPSVDPVPVGQGPHDLNPPRLPPNAWPTYAPHNNYSRVGYPTEYPASAFPFIGPFYPFPKVPLGFRSIKLEWEDGHWYYGRNATNRDWWKVRYW